MWEVVPLKCAFSSCFLVILLVHSIIETYVPKCTADVWVLWYWAIVVFMWILYNFLTAFCFPPSIQKDSFLFTYALSVPSVLPAVSPLIKDPLQDASG